MVNALAISAAFVGASLATVAQGAALKQSPLFGCVSFAKGELGLATPDSEDFAPANFIAGLTATSAITKETRLSQLATHTRTGADVAAGAFEFLNCTQSLLDRGLKLNVPANFQALNAAAADDEEAPVYTFSWGVLRNQASLNHGLSAQKAPSAAGAIDATPIVHSKIAKTPVTARTFVLATADDGVTNFLQFYTFSGNRSTTSYQATKRYGIVNLTSKTQSSRPGSKFLALINSESTGFGGEDGEDIEDDPNTV